jgi:hypothetical protein
MEKPYCCLQPWGGRGGGGESFCGLEVRNLVTATVACGRADLYVT